MGPVNKIEYIKIQGFRSLADVEFKNLPDAAVLIGPNGSGKSNLFRFFDMMSSMIRARRLRDYVARQGGADDQLFGGSARTPQLKGELGISTSHGLHEYSFTLEYGNPDQLSFSEEKIRFSGPSPDCGKSDWQDLGSGHLEAALVEAAQGQSFPGVDRTNARVLVSLLRNTSEYQFHNTSNTSGFKNKWDVSLNNRLSGTGRNLAAVLYRLEQEDLKRYEYICNIIGRILPGFDRFDLQEEYGKVLLRWKPKWSDKTIGAHLTSDGSLRFFALVTLLNLPSEMLPDVILLDEPELGLHPTAVKLVGAMIRSLSVKRQIIVATQSPLLVDEFDLKEIFVTNLKEGQTKIQRPNKEELRHWLEDHTTGEMWMTNIMGGRP